MDPRTRAKHVGLARRGRSRAYTTVVALVAVAASSLPVSATTMLLGSRPASAVTVGRAVPPGRARHGGVGLPAGWTQTWSTGALPDAGQPIALSSPVPADLDGQPSVVVGDRRGTS